MKRLIVTVLVLYSTANAGFFGSLVGGALGASSGERTVQQIVQKKSRMDKVNTYLWNMHEKGAYTKDYKFYLNYLEHSDDINHLDTVAWVYKDHSNRAKAIEIYKKRIMPWVKIEKPKIQQEYQKYFQQISAK